MLDAEQRHQLLIQRRRLGIRRDLVERRLLVGRGGHWRGAGIGEALGDSLLVGVVARQLAGRQDRLDPRAVVLARQANLIDRHSLAPELSPAGFAGPTTPVTVASSISTSNGLATTAAYVQSAISSF